MHISVRSPSGVAALAVAFASVTVAGAPGRKTATAKAVSSSPSTASCAGPTWSAIRRRPALVGRLIAAVLRVARPRDDEAVDLGRRRATAARRGKLTDAERRTAPPANGAGMRRTAASLFADAATSCWSIGAGTRRAITRTTGAEANPRWARHETADHLTRDDNLFIVPVDERPGSQQLTDVAPKKARAAR